MGFCQNTKQAYFIFWGRLYKKVLYLLREHATNVFNFEKNNMLPLTKQNLFIAQDLWQVHYQGRRKLGTIVILQVNIEAQQIVIVI